MLPNCNEMKRVAAYERYYLVLEMDTNRVLPLILDCFEVSNVGVDQGIDTTNIDKASSTYLVALVPSH